MQIRPPPNYCREDVIASRNGQHASRVWEALRKRVWPLKRIDHSWMLWGLPYGDLEVVSSASLDMLVHDIRKYSLVIIMLLNKMYLCQCTRSVCPLLCCFLRDGCLCCIIPPFLKAKKSMSHRVYHHMWKAYFAWCKVKKDTAKILLRQILIFL